MVEKKKLHTDVTNDQKAWPKQKYGHQEAKQTHGYVLLFFLFSFSSGNIPDHQTLDFFFFARQLFKVSK